MIRTRSDFLNALRRDREKYDADSFIERYPKELSMKEALELLEDDGEKLRSYFRKGKTYAQEIDGRQRHRYIVLLALLCAHEEKQAKVTDAEFLRCLLLLLQGNKKLDRYLKQVQEILGNTKNKGKAVQEILQQVIPSLQDYLYKERKDDFRRNIGYRVFETTIENESDKKRVYVDNIELLRAFEEYLESRRSTETIKTGKKTGTPISYMPDAKEKEIWKKLYQMLKSCTPGRAEERGVGELFIPLVVDHRAGTGIYIVGRNKIPPKRGKLPDFYGLCCICVLRFAGLSEVFTEDSFDDLDYFIQNENRTDKDIPFSEIRYAITICADKEELMHRIDIEEACKRSIEIACRKYGIYRENNNFYYSAILNEWPSSDVDPEVRERFRDFFEPGYSKDPTPTQKERDIMKAERDNRKKEEQAAKRKHIKGRDIGFV